MHEFIKSLFVFFFSEYYNSHWQDEDLMMKLKVGDHAVFYDPIRDYVRRIYYVEEEENGSLRVYLIDDLIYASTMPSQIRKVGRIIRINIFPCLRYFLISLSRMKHFLDVRNYRIDWMFSSLFLFYYF